MYYVETYGQPPQCHPYVSMYLYRNVQTTALISLRQAPVAADNVYATSH